MKAIRRATKDMIAAHKNPALLVVYLSSVQALRRDEQLLCLGIPHRIVEGHLGTYRRGSRLGTPGCEL